MRGSSDPPAAAGGHRNAPAARPATAFPRLARGHSLPPLPRLPDHRGEPRPVGRRRRPLREGPVDDVQVLRRRPQRAGVGDRPVDLRHADQQPHLPGLPGRRLRRQLGAPGAGADGADRRAARHRFHRADVPQGDRPQRLRVLRAPLRLPRPALRLAGLRAGAVRRHGLGVLPAGAGGLQHDRHRRRDGGRGARPGGDRPDAPGRDGGGHLARRDPGRAPHPGRARRPARHRGQDRRRPRPGVHGRGRREQGEPRFVRLEPGRADLLGDGDQRHLLRRPEVRHRPDDGAALPDGQVGQGGDSRLDRRRADGRAGVGAVHVHRHGALRLLPGLRDPARRPARRRRVPALHPERDAGGRDRG